MSFRFRSDIDGLRALAVTLVVLFHADAPGFAGGFVGVDVFFVISGFLITKKLLSELAEQGRINLVTFWLGRAKRLLPAASVMIAATTALQLLVRNPLYWRDAINEAWAAAFYFSNEAIARTSVGYFDETGLERALLHTWSLSVEEQFYIVWPLLLSVLVGARVRRAGALVGVLACGSIMLSAVLTMSDSPFAYLSAAGRAWEFLFGAALALPSVASRLHRLLDGRLLAQPLVAIAGFASILGSSVLLSESVGFPFPTALIPVLGTAAVIASNVEPRSILGRALSVRPVQHLGRLSYSWYLWHWPIMVLGSELLDRYGLDTRLGLVAIALVVAAASHRFVENPVRHLKPKTVSGLAIVGLALPSLLVAGTLIVATNHDNNEFGPPEALALRDAKADWPDQFELCNLPIVLMLEEHCVGGDVEAPVTVLLVGDSHAAHWFPALDTAGADQGIRLVAMHQGNCPATVLRDSPSLTDVCRRVVDELDVVIDHFDPSIVAISHSDSYGELQPDEWKTGLDVLAQELALEGRSLLIIHDVPRFDFDPLLCLADRGPTTSQAVADCSAPRDQIDERAAPVRAAERSVADDNANVIGWDPIDLICEATRCAPRVDGTLIYLDAHHITVSFSRSLADELKPPLAAALEQATSR